MDSVFIMGGDSLDYFETWMRPDVIAQTAIILVIVRENFPRLQMEEKIAHIKNLFPADIRLLSCDRMDVSSTQVRGLLKAESKAAEHGVSRCLFIRYIQNPTRRKLYSRIKEVYNP